eukprot:TRINITY_DN30747_c0_g1_i1.p1 TRINITY_DN30747_c0_g1~~TRINITY_DN30747_c0_g1_i1.p1  ORF type:complete len:442 (-),score=118.50 TRINITY_DN30747_c0_g1_i1:98-1423(-)
MALMPQKLLPLLLLSLSVAVLVGGEADETATHHGIIFDAGSSGSRIHVYTWRTGGSVGDFELVEDDLRKQKPGLSSFAAEPSKAGGSLAELLRHAERKVPKEKQASTPVFLMATAGLRLAGEDAANAILRSVGDTLEASPFLFRREWAYILPGKEEGVFGWVTVNYLLGSLSGDAGRTSAAIDLGGGSVQLVYAAPAGAIAETSEHGGQVTFAGRTHQLYIASHLGFGLDKARERIALNLAQSIPSGVVLEHPCVPAGHQLSVSVGAGTVREFVGTGSYAACEASYKELLGDEVRCAAPPCGSLGAADRPPLPESIFGFSYLFDRTRAIGLFDGKVEEFGAELTTVADIRRAAMSICALTPAEAQRRFADCEDAAKWANFCGDTAYLAALLEIGFGISPDVKLTVGNKVAGVELVWTLGAVIAKSAALGPRAEVPKRSQEL